MPVTPARRNKNLSTAELQGWPKEEGAMQSRWHRPNVAWNLLKNPVWARKGELLDALGVSGMAKAVVLNRVLLHQIETVLIDMF